MKNILAGQLAFDAMLIMRYLTLESVKCALACGPRVRGAKSLYLNPDTNDPVIVEDAAEVMDAIDPYNAGREMVFYPEFIKKAVERIQSSTFEEETGCHTVRVRSDLYYDSATICFRLKGSLHILNIILRSDGNKCALHDRLLEEAALSVYESVFKQGTSMEQKEVVELFRQMSQHVCHKHENKGYLELMVNLFLGLDAS
jgi:hypothetical protein